MLLSDKFEEISEAVSLFKLGIYHNIIFEKTQEWIEGIIKNITFDFKVRVEAASVFPHLFEFQEQLPSEDFMQILLALIPDEENMIELANEPSLNRFHRFWILFRNEFQINTVINEYDWSETWKHLLIKATFENFDNKDDMVFHQFYKNVNDFEEKNNIKGSSFFRDYILESLLLIIKSEQTLSSQNINNIINIWSDIDKNMIIDLRYIFSKDDYLKFWVEMWLKCFVKPKEIMRLQSNKATEDLASSMINLKWSSYFIQ